MTKKTTDTSQIAMSEDQLLALVIDYAKLKGWLVHHVRPAWSAKGYRTPLQGDCGFPDLILLKQQAGDKFSRIIFIELKSAKGKLLPEQLIWKVAIEETYDGEYYLVRPSMWESGEIQKILD